MVDVYVLPVYDRAGGRLECPVDDVSAGYQQVLVYDRAGIGHRVTNSPAAAPPTGMFPCNLRDGSTVLIPFGVRSLLPGFEFYFGQIQNVVEEFFSTAVGNIPQPLVSVQWDDGPSANQNIERIARVKLTCTGSRYLGVGANYTLRFECLLAIELWGPLDVGVGDSIRMIRQLDTFMRQTLPTYNFYPHSQRNLRRISQTGDGGTRWGIEYNLPFSFDTTIARPAQTGTQAFELEDVVSAVQTAFKDLIATPLALPVQYDNSPWPGAAVDELWAKTNVDQYPVVGGISESGRLRGRRAGSLTVLIYCPLQEGGALAWRMVDSIVRSFTGTTHGGAVFDIPTASLVGRDDVFWTIAVEVPFTVDETQ